MENYQPENFKLPARRNERKTLKCDLNGTVNVCNRPIDAMVPKSRQETIPLKRHDLLRWYGWGYNDTYVTVDEKTGELHSSSNRYPSVLNCHVAPSLREYLKSLLNIDLFKTTEELLKPICMPESYPKPIINEDFVSEIINLELTYSLDGEDRYIRAHGHGIDELLTLRERKQFKRMPDIILWPECHTDVVQIVELASLHNVVIIPYGGGTNVSRALSCNPEERRMIVSLDTSQMNRVLWVDKVNQIACCEAGIIGQDLGRELEKHGLTTGHEPDSYEFSSLGGWVATRASGMKKNQYGNIEDLVVQVRFVTPSGVLEKKTLAPRVSLGPDFTQIVLGSEGTLGVVTEVILKVRPIPAVQEFGSFVFPNFQLGVDFMYEVARKRHQPASLRLMDNDQYKMGQVMTENGGYFGPLIEYIKMFYVTKYQGISLDELSVVIAVFEGEQDEVTIQKNRILMLAQKHQGFAAGSANGKRGYSMTFTISYIRDISFAHGVLTESFETSVPWNRVITLTRNVKNVVTKECKRQGIQYFMITCRLAQVYDTGACLYFYFGYNMVGVSDALHKYEEIEALARDEIIACGGSLSHHHGVGKVRQKWFSEAVSPLGVELCKAVKRQLDPNNIFAVGNLWKQ